MATVTKKELIDRIADRLEVKRVVVKKVIQGFLDEVIDELGRDNRLEFRDFGVFKCKIRAARMAQNPKTLQRVPVPQQRTVKFKVGRLMKARMARVAEQHVGHVKIAAPPLPHHGGDGVATRAGSAAHAGPSNPVEV